jgi:hypothetical protein
VRIHFSRASGSGKVPLPARTFRSGAWQAAGLEGGIVYVATPVRSGWSFTPGSVLVSQATDTVNFTGVRGAAAVVAPPVAAEAEAAPPDTLAVPPAAAEAQTNAMELWLASGFRPGTVYQVDFAGSVVASSLPAGAPSTVGLPPGAADSSAHSSRSAASPTQGAAGRVTLAGQSDHSGVTIAFTRAFGTGSIPAAVETQPSGAWWAEGFEAGTVYVATPRRAGWRFTPAQLQFSAATASTPLAFTGAPGD